MQTACLRLMGKKLLVALTMGGKFAVEGLQSIDENDDMLSTLARELVARNGIGETADAVWKTLNTEHQKLLATTREAGTDLASLNPGESAMNTLDTPGPIVEEALAAPVLIFGQRPNALSGRRPRSKPVVSEQASPFG